MAEIAGENLIELARTNPIAACNKVSPSMIDWSQLPEHMRDGFAYYIALGIEPGAFGMAILRNDLKEALGRADHINRHRMFDIVGWFYMHAPSACWGSPEKVAQWTEQGGWLHARAGRTQ